MENAKLHHVGIIFMSLEQAQAFADVFGLQEEYRAYVEAYQAWCIFMRPNGGSMVELVVPTGGKLTAYNGGKGGIHHIAYAVDDIEKTRLDFAEKGVRLLEEKAVKGAGNIIVNFMRPKDGKGVLVEFVETIENNE